MAERLEDYLQCPTCINVFNDPLILPCSHSFCRACLEQWIDTLERSCPLCGKGCGSMFSVPNLALKNLCENLPRTSVKSEDMCRLHEEKFHLFCLDHQELVCLACKDKKIHVGHTLLPLGKIVKGHLQELQRDLQKAKERLKDYSNCRENCNEQLEYIQVQREKVERKIRKDFEELRCFLNVEEAARLAAVREEEQKKISIMKGRIVVFGLQMDDLSDSIRSTEELMTFDNVSFLKKFKTVMSRIQVLPDKPELLQGGLLDEVKHVGNLKFKVWERMKETLAYRPVILDPNTAGLRIRLSEDLSSLSWEEGEQERPKNLERLWECVLGGALDPGRHVWEVEVGDNISWAVGVQWRDPCLPNLITGWFIGFRDGNYKKSSGKYGEWNPPVKIQSIRVEVDMNERSLSFYEPLTKTQLWSVQKHSDWPDLSGNTKMYPYFYTTQKSPLKIMPIPLNVTTAIRHVGTD